MLSMTRWNPFEELTGLHREMDRVFGRYMGDERATTPASAWIPATEVDSGEDGWKIRIALPGIAPKDVHIDLHDNNLTISGERTRTERNGRGVPRSSTTAASSGRSRSRPMSTPRRSAPTTFMACWS